VSNPGHAQGPPSNRIRLGAKVPNSGPLPFKLGIARMAARLEAAGFESIWTSDHVVFPHEVHSRYPFAADGVITWPVDVDYLEPVVALSAMTATTSTAELGTSVLILPMRNPILFAKQAACIDALSGGAGRRARRMAVDRAALLDRHRRAVRGQPLSAADGHPQPARASAPAARADRRDVAKRARASRA
jgi:hypothetical protein